MGLPIQLNYYSNTDTSIIDLQNTADGVFIGHHAVSLTNYTNTSLPAIAIGSKVENNGSFFNFTTECAISGSPSDGTVYIYLVPSGDPALGTATVTPTFTNTAPTWSDTKQGWYGTVGSANYRYLEFIIYKSGSSYSPKRKFNFKENNINDLFSTYIFCTLSADQTITTDQIIQFNTKNYDYNSEFDTTNYKFIAAKDGLYYFNLKFYLQNLSSANPTNLYPKKNGTEISNRRVLVEGSSASSSTSYMCIFTEYLSASDEITFFISNTGDASFQVDYLLSFLEIVRQ